MWQHGEPMRFDPRMRVRHATPAGWMALLRYARRARIDDRIDPQTRRRVVGRGRGVLPSLMTMLVGGKRCSPEENGCIDNE